MFFFKRRKSKKEAKKQLKLEEEQQKLAKEEVKEPEAKEVVKEEPKKVEEKAKVEQKPKAAVTEKEPQPTTTQAASKYHVSQNKDEKSNHYKQWRVRKEGSKKTIKFFDTQAEAITFAEDLADKAGSSIVIHKVDGSIRKQDYTKK